MKTFDLICKILLVFFVTIMLSLVVSSLIQDGATLNVIAFLIGFLVPGPLFKWLCKPDTEVVPTEDKP